MSFGNEKKMRFIRERIVVRAVLLAALFQAGMSEYDEDQVVFELNEYPAAPRRTTENDWFTAAANAEADPRLFHKTAGEKFSKYEARIAELKSKLATDSRAAGNPKSIQGLDKNLEKARRHFKIYKAASDIRQPETRETFESSMKDFRAQLAAVSSTVFDPKENYDWQLRSALEDRQYQVEQLRAGLPQLADKERAKAERRIRLLEEKNKKNLERLETIKGAGKDSWEGIKKETDSDLKSFDETYLETLTKFKSSTT